MNKLTYLAGASFLISALGYSNVLASPTQSVNIVPAKSNPYGQSYEQHVMDFWKWVLALPRNSSPWDDPTGKNCLSGQSGSNSSVFYLSGNGGGKSNRICEVPAGKGLFIPVSPMEISDEEAPNKSIDELHRIAQSDQDSVTSLYLKINDREYGREELDNYRIDTNAFNVSFPKNAVFGANEGDSVAVADGYYVITDPLIAGNYTIVYRSTLSLPFAQDITYHIIAK